MPRPRTHLLSAASEPDFASMWTPKQRPPPLDAFRSDEKSEQAARALVQGPTPRSNWLIPGTVLCGDRTSAGERAGAVQCPRWPCRTVGSPSDANCLALWWYAVHYVFTRFACAHCLETLAAATDMGDDYAKFLELFNE